MESNATSIEGLFQKIKEYVDTRVDLIKLKSINKVSSFFSGLITSLVLLVLFALILLCFTVGLALLIGSWLGNIWGFFIVAGIYIIIGLVLFSARTKLLKTPISNKLLKELLD